MAEPPVEAQREVPRAGDQRPPGGPVPPPYPAYPLPYPRKPPVVVRADLLPALSALSLVALTGVPLAWLWALLAPGQTKGVSQSGQLVPLLAESTHRFDAIGVFLLLGLGAGLVVGVGAWLVRERRGPVMMVGVVLGSLAAAWLATMMLGLFTSWYYEVPAAPKVGDVFTLAPELESMWVLLAQPLTTALTYGVLAAWNGLDDLGRRLG